MSDYKHGDWYCKPASEAEAKEIIELAVASGALRCEIPGDPEICNEYSWDCCDSWGVLYGETYVGESTGGFRNSTQYTIAELRQKFPLPGEQLNDEEEKSVGWHGECSSNNKGATWHECVVLPDGFIAYSYTKHEKKFWDIDRINGLNFRPLRTEREKWVEAAVKIHSAHQWTAESFAESLYDAIKSGQIKAPEAE